MTKLINDLKSQDPDQTVYHRIIATLFVESQKHNYNRLIINTFDTDGGNLPKSKLYFLQMLIRIFPKN